MRQTKIINLYGGPSSGKSTAMADTFGALKRRGYLVEMAPEWVKLPVWAGELHVLKDQLYIFAKQNRQLIQLKGAVDFVVTDAPLLLSLVYGPPNPTLSQLVMEVTQTYQNLHVFVKRVKPYEPAGRVQSEDEARELDRLMRNMLLGANAPFHVVPGDDSAADRILEQIL